MSDVIIRPLDIERDTEGLARMWNDSDLQWPASWTRGVPITAETVREWDEEERGDIIYVAEVDGEIAGYCSFFVDVEGRPGEGYLALLNVNPRFQKRSIGRRLIQATIDYSVAKGFKRQTLHTWSANFKAVPTYKKTGHFWTPDQSVWMQNYIPGALQMSLARPFFAKHDWYASYVRELRQDEDDQRWEGLKVYTQHWEADGEALTIWIDREARAPVAIETDALQVAAIVEEIEPVAGASVTLRWRIINKSSEALSVHLHALGDKGINIDHRDAWTVPAGETILRSAEVKVADDAPPSKEDGTAPAVRSLLRINDTEVELFSGLRAKKPLRVDTAPGQISLLPGAAQTVHLQVHNERTVASRVGVWLTPPAGLVPDWTQQTLEVPAKGHASLDLGLQAVQEGAYTLAVRLEDLEGKLKAVNEGLAILTVAPGGLVVHQNGNAVRVETENLRVSAEPKAGKLKVEDKDRRFQLTAVEPMVGQPYFPSQFEDKEFDLAVEQRGGRIVLYRKAEAKSDEGLWLHQEVTLSASGFITLSHWLENRGSKRYARQIRLHLHPSDGERQGMVLPLSTGIVRSQNGEYPATEQDAPRDPNAYAEPWCAWERQGTVTGIAWDATVARIWNMHGVETTSQELVAEPGQRSAVTQVAIIAQHGDWRMAREAAMRWRGLWRPEPAFASAHSEPRPPALARVEPGLVVTLDDDVTASLLVDATVNRPSNGHVMVHTAPGLTCDLAQAEVHELRRGQERAWSLRFNVPQGVPGIYRGETELDLALWRHTQPFWVAKLGTRASVQMSEGSVQGKRVWTIDNGASRFLVSPDYGPSMIAWEQDGQNQLWSTFPEPEGWSWVYPWFGGIHAKLYPAGTWLSHGLLHREQCEIMPVTATDARGIAWQGVRISTCPQREQLRDWRVEVDYLTVGAANLLKLVYRLTNLRDAEQSVQVASEVAASLGATGRDLTLVGQEIQQRPMPWGMFVGDQTWGALTNEKTGKTLVMVGAQPDISLRNGGSWGRLLGSWQELRLSGGQTRELVYYIAITETLAQARDYTVLTRY